MLASKAKNPFDDRRTGFARRTRGLPGRMHHLALAAFFTRPQAEGSNRREDSMAKSGAAVNRWPADDGRTAFGDISVNRECAFAAYTNIRAL
jgi:hypothetical protein